MTRVADREKTGKANENPATRGVSNSQYAAVDPMILFSTDPQSSGVSSEQYGSKYFPQRRRS